MAAQYSKADMTAAVEEVLLRHYRITSAGYPVRCVCGQVLVEKRGTLHYLVTYRQMLATHQAEALLTAGIL